MYVLLSAKILVAGGTIEGVRNTPLEIIDLINTKLKSDIVLDENRSICAATGGVLQNQLLICRGYDCNPHFNTRSNICIIGMPNHGFKMTISRRLASSVVLNKSKIWVTCGLSNIGNVERSTEIISLDQQPVPGPDLPFTVYGHSMVLVNPSTIYLIGGSQNDHIGSNKTWAIDPTNDFQIKVGPSLNVERKNHSCSKMRIEGRIFLVVAGGENYNHSYTMLDSVELLDTTCPDQGWKMGMK